MEIIFPQECEEYINLQCNGDKSLYTNFPENKNIEEYLVKLKPKKILDIGAGVGRASVWLFKKYGWDKAEFTLLDGNEGNKQYDEIRKKKGEYYNDWEVAKKFCEANGLNVNIAHPEKFGDLEGGFDLVYSFLAIGFHWPIDFYLYDLYNLCAKGCLLIFGLRGVEAASWIDRQIESINKKQYDIVEYVLKKTKTRESVLVLKRK